MGVWWAHMQLSPVCLVTGKQVDGLLCGSPAHNNLTFTSASSPLILVSPMFFFLEVTKRSHHAAVRRIKGFTIPQLCWEANWWVKYEWFVITWTSNTKANKVLNCYTCAGTAIWLCAFDGCRCPGQRLPTDAEPRVHDHHPAGLCVARSVCWTSPDGQPQTLPSQHSHDCLQPGYGRAECLHSVWGTCFGPLGKWNIEIMLLYFAWI